MPQRLRQDLDQALALRDDAARRAAVDRVVQGITAGTYGPAFQRQTESVAARHRAPSDLAHGTAACRLRMNDIGFEH
ncbi:hypothetical protein [Streptomyces coerulescens]|uniref:Uncharacterized protein n=1 Tax=Streptomyces coerulescens TaxID=29304 RepID=A0ABW0CX44_STRCD